MNAYKTALLVAGVALLGVTGTPTPDAALRDARPDESPQPPTALHGAHSAPARSADLDGLLEQYCVRCHNERRLRGDLSLEGFDTDVPKRTPRSPSG